MVTTKDFDHLRAMNFGAGMLDKPLRADAIREEIECYNPSDAAQVCARMRNEAGMVESARQWARVYGEVLEEFARVHSATLINDADKEFEVLTAYLRKPGFDDRVEWERQQLKRLKSIPLIGPSVFRLARRILMRWTGYSGLR
jgi:hypothetical protein